MARPKRDVSASVQRLDAILSAEGDTPGETPAAEAVVARPKRPPVISTRMRLSVAGLDTKNFHYHWFNDVDDNIPRRLEEGYVFVDKDKKQVGDRTAYDSQSTSSLMHKSVGQGIKAYLMCIPQELWIERQKATTWADADDREHYITERVKSEKGFHGSVKITSR